MGGVRRSLTITLAALAASTFPAAAGAQDPGSADWEQVPRDRIAAECGLDPDVLDAAAAEVRAHAVRRDPPRQALLGGRASRGHHRALPGLLGHEDLRGDALRDGRLPEHHALRRGSRDRVDPGGRAGRHQPAAKLAHVLAMVSTNADLRPGKKGAWSYDTTGDREINTLVGVMDRAIAAEPERFPGVKNVVELAQKELFDPLGMKASSWPGEVIGGNLTTNVRDMARLGQLVLQRGRWQGRQLIDEEYLYRMTHPAFEDVNTGYGYLTYVNAAKNWTWPTSTADTYCAPFGRWPSYPHRPVLRVPGHQRRRARRAAAALRHRPHVRLRDRRPEVRDPPRRRRGLRHPQRRRQRRGRRHGRRPVLRTQDGVERDPPGDAPVRPALQGRRGRVLRRLPAQRVRPRPARAVVQGHGHAAGGGRASRGGPPAGAPDGAAGAAGPSRVRGPAASALPAAAGAALGGGLRQRQARARGRAASGSAGRSSCGGCRRARSAWWSSGGTRKGRTVVQSRRYRTCRR